MLKIVENCEAVVILVVLVAGDIAVVKLLVLVEILVVIGVGDVSVVKLLVFVGIPVVLIVGDVASVKLLVFVGAEIASKLALKAGDGVASVGEELGMNDNTSVPFS